MHSLLSEPSGQLVTLTGPGGVGKTRLAGRFAHELNDIGTLQPIWISLAPLESSEQVAQAIGQPFGIKGSEASSLPDRLAANLLGRQTFVILDNFEHVAAAAPLIAELLQSCPTLTVLATSRGPLNISWERELRIDPLPLPDEHSVPADIESNPAVQLFLSRAAPGHPSVDDLLVVGAICRRLDGLPLAIELAAPWLRLLTARELLKRLDRRLPLLTGGPADAPPRLHSMRDAIRWSYALLSEPERRLFRRLAIFPEGCTLEAAEFVANPDGIDLDFGADETLHAMAQLVNRGLVRPPERERFRMLQTIREYGLELLESHGEREECARRLMNWWLSQTGEPLFDPLDGYLWAPPEHMGDRAGLTAALGFALEHQEFESALRLAICLSPIWAEQGRYGEARQALGSIVAGLPESAAEARAIVSGWIAEWAWLHSDYAATATLAADALDACRSLGLTAGVAANTYRLGRVATITNPAAGLAYLDDALAMAQQASDPLGGYWCRIGLGHVSLALGDHDASRRWFDEAGIELERIGDAPGAWLTLGLRLGIARLLLETDGLEQAGRLLESALTLSRQQRNPYFECLALAEQCELMRRQQNYARAVQAAREGVQIAQQLGNRYREWQCLSQLCQTAHDAGKLDQTLTLCGAASALGEELGILQIPPDIADLMSRSARMADLHAAGRKLSSSERLAQAMALELELSRISRYSGVLSHRERDVLDLLADGLTNEVIAGRLYVSRRTVDTHVGAILRKLQVASRHEAVATARKQGIVKTSTEPADSGF